MVSTKIIAMSMGLAGAAAAWPAWPWLRRANQQQSLGRAALVLIALGLFLRLVIAFWLPTFQAPDEQSHFNYIKFIFENGVLPVQTAKTGSLANDWEYYQPPLYYLLQLGPYSLASLAGLGVAGKVMVCRLFSVSLWLLTALLARAIFSSLMKRDDPRWVVALSVVCFLPTYVFSSTAINNDNLIVMWGALIVWMTLRWRPTENDHVLALMGLVLGVSMETKLTSIAFFLYAGAFVGAVAWRRGRLGRAVVGYTLLGAVMAGAIATPWFVRNVMVYGSANTEHVANVAFNWPSPIHAFVYSCQNLFQTFWAASGIYNNIQARYPSFGIALMALAAFGLVKGWRENRQSLVHPNGQAFFVASAVTFVMLLVLVLRFGFLYAQAQGRFMFPILSALSLFLAVGFTAVAGNKRVMALPAILVMYAVSFLSYSLYMLIVVPQ